MKLRLFFSAVLLFNTSSTPMEYAPLTNVIIEQPLEMEHTPEALLRLQNQVKFLQKKVKNNSAVPISSIDGNLEIQSLLENNKKLLRATIGDVSSHHETYYRTNSDGKFSIIFFIFTGAFTLGIALDGNPLFMGGSGLTAGAAFGFAYNAWQLRKNSRCLKNIYHDINNFLAQNNNQHNGSKTLDWERPLNLYDNAINLLRENYSKSHANIYKIVEARLKHTQAALELK